MLNKHINIFYGLSDNIKFISLIFFVFICLSYYSLEINSEFYFYGVLVWLNIILGCLGLSLFYHSLQDRETKSLVKIFEIISGPYMLLGGGILYWPVLKHQENNSLVALCFLTWILISLIIKGSFFIKSDIKSVPFILNKRFLLFFCVCMFFLTFSYTYDGWFKILEKNWFTADDHFYILFNILKIWNYIGVFTEVYILGIAIENFLGYNTLNRSIILKKRWKTLFILTLLWGLCWAIYNYMILLQGMPGSIRRIGDLFAKINGINLVGCFLIPFLFLLTPSAKKDPLSIKIIVFWIFLFHFSDMLWHIAPMFTSVELQLRDIVSVCVMSLLWLFLLKKEYKNRSLIYGSGLY